MSIRYHVRLPVPAMARGVDPALSFHAIGAGEFAAQLQVALRDDVLFRRWRDLQADPDSVDPQLGVVDPAAHVNGEQADLHVDLVVTTTLPGAVLKHRLRLLAGPHWELRDVSLG